MLEAAAASLASPMILAFVLGIAAGLARSDLSVPEAMSKGMAIYLMFAIGLKGGATMASTPLDATAAGAILAGVLLSFALPLLAFALLRGPGGAERTTAAAVAAHYGSISIVTFVTAAQFLTERGIPYEAYLLAVVALMETPAILSGLWLARDKAREGPGKGLSGELLREICLNGSVVLLIGAFAIGWIVGPGGVEPVRPFFDELFKGVLCLFLLDMGLQAAGRLRGVKVLTARLVAFGLYMPPLGAAIGLLTGWAIGLGPGGATLLGVLCGSASYIAVPAAMRLALPQANPAVYVTLSLAVTFPFNVVVGIPLYLAAAGLLYGA